MISNLECFDIELEGVIGVMLSLEHTLITDAQWISLYEYPRLYDEIDVKIHTKKSLSINGYWVFDYVPKKAVHVQQTQYHNWEWYCTAPLVETIATTNPSKMQRIVHENTVRYEHQLEDKNIHRANVHRNKKRKRYAFLAWKHWVMHKHPLRTRFPLMHPQAWQVYHNDPQNRYFIMASCVRVGSINTGVTKRITSKEVADYVRMPNGKWVCETEKITVSDENDTPPPPKKQSQSSQQQQQQSISESVGSIYQGYMKKEMVLAPYTLIAKQTAVILDHTFDVVSRNGQYWRISTKDTQNLKRIDIGEWTATHTPSGHIWNAVRAMVKLHRKTIHKKERWNYGLTFLYQSMFFAGWKDVMEQFVTNRIRIMKILPNEVMVRFQYLNHTIEEYRSLLQKNPENFEAAGRLLIGIQHFMLGIPNVDNDTLRNTIVKYDKRNNMKSLCEKLHVQESLLRQLLGSTFRVNETFLQVSNTDLGNQMFNNLSIWSIMFHNASLLFVEPSKRIEFLKWWMHLEIQYVKHEILYRKAEKHTSLQLLFVQDKRKKTKESIVYNILYHCSYVCTREIMHEVLHPDIPLKKKGQSSVISLESIIQPLLTECKLPVISWIERWIKTGTFVEENKICKLYAVV